MVSLSRVLNNHVEDNKKGNIFYGSIPFELKYKLRIIK